MIYFILAVCLISSASAINFTISAVIKLERENNYNIETDNGRSARHGFQHKREIRMENDDALWKPSKRFSQELAEESDGNNEKIHSKEDLSARNPKANKELQLRGSHSYDDKHNYDENDDSNQREKHDSYDQDDYENSSDDDNDGGTLRFTRPLIHIGRGGGHYTKHHKKINGDLDSTEKWHQQNQKSDSEDRDAFENKYFYGKVPTTKKVEETTKPSFFQNKSASEVASMLKNHSMTGKELIQNIKNDSKYGDKFNKLLNESKPAAAFVEKLENNTFLQGILMQYAKDEKSIDKLMQMLNKSMAKTDPISSKPNFNNWADKLKNTTIPNSWKIKNKNKTLDSVEHWKQYIKDDKSYIVDTWKNISFKNETINTIENKEIYLTTPSTKDWNKNQVKVSTQRVFYSTKHIWIDYEENISMPKDDLRSVTKKVAEVSKNFQKIHNETQIEFANLYKELNKERLKIQNNSTINAFTKRILTRTLKLFDDMEKRTTEYRWKKKMKYLARNYEDKFNEFLRASKQHTIRTRFGTRKVILNSIDVSNRIVKRLLDFMADDMEKRGLTYNNLTPQIFRSEISKEEDWELKRACKKFHICRSQKGFIDFIIDVLMIMLRAPNIRFGTAFTSMIEAAKITNFAFEPNVNEGIRMRLDYYNRQDVHVQKGMLMIVKNIIVNRNSPLIMYADVSPRESKIIQRTLAFLEIINTFPSNKRNRNNWYNINQEFTDWSNGKKDGVQNTSIKFMTLINNAINGTDAESKDIISRNANILFT